MEFDIRPQYQIMQVPDLEPPITIYQFPIIDEEVPYISLRIPKETLHWGLVLDMLKSHIVRHANIAVQLYDSFRMEPAEIVEQYTILDNLHMTIDTIITRMCSNTSKEATPSCIVFNGAPSIIYLYGSILRHLPRLLKDAPPQYHQPGFIYMSIITPLLTKVANK